MFSFDCIVDTHTQALPKLHLQKRASSAGSATTARSEERAKSASPLAPNASALVGSRPSPDIIPISASATQPPLPPQSRLPPAVHSNYTRAESIPDHHNNNNDAPNNNAPSPASPGAFLASITALSPLNGLDVEPVESSRSPLEAFEVANGFKSLMPGVFSPPRLSSPVPSWLEGLRRDHSRTPEDRELARMTQWHRSSPSPQEEDVLTKFCQRCLFAYILVGVLT